MARKISVTKEMVKSAAFAIMREEGMDGLTARRLADKTGCSTQPIFRIYENMNELHEEAFAMAIAYYTDFYRAFMKDRPIEKPFVNFGLAYISFALKEPSLFRVLFLSKERYGQSLYELLNGQDGKFKTEIARAQEAKERALEKIRQMWIFIHGAACMTITGDYDLPEAETKRLLLESYEKNA
jgi:AcrR family transcriptional regulator